MSRAKKRNRRQRHHRQAPSVKSAPVLSVQRRPFTLHGLMLCAGITLGLCGIVFGLWEMRRYMMVRADYADLKEKRLELIDHIKSCNREIAALQNEVTELKRAGGGGRTKRENAEISPPRWHDSTASQEADRFPLSFDNGNVRQKTVALTFDGGSISNAAGDILDTLKSRGIRATIFVTGDFLRAYPDVARRIASEGHETGNHTFSHPHLTSWVRDHTQTTLPLVSEELLCGELSRTDSLFFSITGSHCARIWRAPYGEKNRDICLWARRCGYLHIGWRQGKTWKQGLDSNDWVPDEETPGFHTPEEVLDKIIALAQSGPDGIAGGIILMHLGTVRKDSRTQVHRMLGRLIDELKQLGYAFVTVSEMLKDSGVDTSPLEKNRHVPVAVSPN